MENGIIYVLTPTGERKPVAVNEDGELIVNVDATVASNVKIEDTTGQPITSGAFGELFTTIIDDNGDPLATDNSNAAAKSLNAKLVDGDGNLLGQAGGIPIYVKGNLGLTDAATEVLAVAIKGPLGENVVSDNADVGNSSVNVKLMASNDTFLGQAGTPLIVNTNGSPVVIKDSADFNIFSQTGETDSETNSALTVTGEYIHKQINSNVDLGFTSITTASPNEYIGNICTVNISEFISGAVFTNKLEKLQIINAQVAAANSGAIDIFLVESGSTADAYFGSLAIPDSVDLDANYPSLEGLLHIVGAVAPENIAGISVYTTDLKFYPETTASTTNINVYISAAEIGKTYSDKWITKAICTKFADGQTF